MCNVNCNVIFIIFKKNYCNCWNRSFNRKRVYEIQQYALAIIKTILKNSVSQNFSLAYNLYIGKIIVNPHIRYDDNDNLLLCSFDVQIRIGGPQYEKRCSKIFIRCIILWLNWTKHYCDIIINNQHHKYIFRYTKFYL